MTSTGRLNISTVIRYKNRRQHNSYPFKHTFFIVTVFHEQDDLPTGITVNGIHLKLAAVAQAIVASNTIISELEIYPFNKLLIPRSSNKTKLTFLGLT